MELLRPAKSKLGRKYALHPSGSHSHQTLKLTRECPQVPGWPHQGGLGHLAGLYAHGAGREVLPEAAGGFTCDYRHMMRPPRDQGQEGSCGAHAWAALKEHNCVQWEMDRGGPSTPLGGYLSVAHFYWLVREAMGTFPEDSGVDNATCASILQGIGVCPESFLPYRADPSQAGNAQCNVAGQSYRVRQPVVVPLDEAHIDAALAAKRVVVLGFSVYESFEETGSDGLVPPLQPGEGLLGGHDVLIVGKDSQGRYIVRNSWGDWGLSGHCLMTPAYVKATGMDAWSTV